MADQNIADEMDLEVPEEAGSFIGPKYYSTLPIITNEPSFIFELAPARSVSSASDVEFGMMDDSPANNQEPPQDLDGSGIQLVEEATSSVDSTPTKAVKPKGNRGGAGEDDTPKSKKPRASRKRGAPTDNGEPSLADIGLWTDAQYKKIRDARKRSRDNKVKAFLSVAHELQNVSEYHRYDQAVVAHNALHRTLELEMIQKEKEGVHKMEKNTKDIIEEIREKNAKENERGQNREEKKSQLEEKKSQFEENKRQLEEKKRQLEEIERKVREQEKEIEEMDDEEKKEEAQFHEKMLNTNPFSFSS